jgi:hypothetical protein
MLGLLGGGLLRTLLPYLLVALLAGGMYWKWTSMVDTIEVQRVEIANQKVAISVMNENFEVMKEVAKEEKEQAVAEAVAKVKLDAIEERLDYEKAHAVSIDSLIFHLP